MWNAFFFRMSKDNSYVGEYQFTTLENPTSVRYRFEGCTNASGSNLNGQDGWKPDSGGNNIIVNTITGALTGQNVAMANGNDTHSHRLNNLNHHITLPPDRQFSVSAVMRAKGGSYYSQVILGVDSSGNGEIDKQAFDFGIDYENFRLKGNKVEHGLSTDTQVKITAVVDPLANSGDGSASLFISDME